MLSVRIVCTNHYMSSPVAGLDVRYSEFRGTEVKQVPVIQIFGATVSGQKTCLHVHGVFPYIYIPYEGSGSHARLMYQIASSLDKALNISFGNASSTTQHVYKVMLVSGRPFYGFHVKNHQYFKIYFYNPLVVKRAVELLQNGAILNKIYQPHEAHIPYILQFMIDYNLYGMSYIQVGNVMYRRDSEHTEALNNILEEHILPERINRMSTCELEADCVAADILNRRAITDEIAVNPGLAAIWEDEKQRRREEARSSQITPQSSQQRPDRAATNSENYYMEILFSKLAAIELQDVSDSDLSLKISPEEERMPYPAETPEDCDLTEASFLDLHVHGSNSSSTLTERTAAREIEKTLVVDEDMVLSLSASYKDGTTPSDTSVILNSQDMQLVEILEDMENGVDDDSILGSQQKELGNQSSENAEDEGNLLDLSQPLQQLCNTEDVAAADSPLPDVESEEEVWDNTFWNEMEGNIPQLDGADDTPIKCRRKRLGVRGKAKQRCLIKDVNIGNEDININTKLDHIDEDVLNDKPPVIESSDIMSNNQGLRNGQLQELVLNGKSPTVPYTSLSLDTHIPEVIVIESDDDNFQNKLEMKNSDPMLEEIPPDSDDLSAELFTDDFESFPLQENGDQENSFQNETSSTYGQELRSNAGVEDYTESDSANSFYIASNTSMPFKNVLIGDPSFTAQPCSSDGDDLIVEDSIVNVSWTGGNVPKSWITADKSLEVDIGSSLLAPYDSGGVQEVSPDKVSHVDNSKIVEQPGPSPAVARRGRRRCASLPKCYKPAQARKTTVNTRSRKSTQKSGESVQIDPSDDPDTLELNLFSQNTASTVSDLSLIVDNTSDILASTVLLPSCSIGSPSDELKRIETLLRQGDIEEIMETSCDSADETLLRLKCNHSAHQQHQEKEIIEIVIDDSNTGENDANKPSEPNHVEEQKKLDQVSAAESKAMDDNLRICEKIMQDILDTVEILALDIDKYTFTNHFKNSRTEVVATNTCSSVAAKKTKIRKCEKKSLNDIPDNRDDKNSTSRNLVILPSFAQSLKVDEGCKDNSVKNNNSFPGQDNDDGAKDQTIARRDNQDSSFHNSSFPAQGNDDGGKDQTIARRDNQDSSFHNSSFPAQGNDDGGKDQTIARRDNQDSSFHNSSFPAKGNDEGGKDQTIARRDNQDSSFHNSSFPAQDDDDGGKDQTIARSDNQDSSFHNSSFPAKGNDDGGKDQTVVKRDNQDSSFQLQQQQQKTNHNSITKNQIVINNNNVELIPQLSVQCAAPSKKHSIKNATNKLESEQKTNHNSISKNQIAANKNNVELIPQLSVQCTAPSKKHSIKNATNKLESELLAQETAIINSDVIGEEPASPLQAQLYSLQTTSLSPRKLRSSSSSETYSRKLARKREKKKEKPNKLSLSSKKKTSTSTSEDLPASESENVINGLQQSIIESPIICRNKLSVTVGRSKEHRLKSDRRASMGKPDIENKLEDFNRNLRNSTKKASVASVRRSIRKLLDMECLQNDSADKNQENGNTDLNQNQKSDAVNSVEEKHTHLGLNDIDTYPAARVKRKSSARDTSKHKCNPKISSSDKAEGGDKQFGSSVIDTIVSCKENIIAIDNIPVTGNTTISTYLPLQHDELLNPKASALKVGIESKPLKSKQFRKRLKKQLLPAPVSKMDVEKQDGDKSINLAQEVAISSSIKQNSISYKKPKAEHISKSPLNIKAVQISISPLNVSQQTCNRAVPAIAEQSVIQPCYIKVEKLKESVIQKFYSEKSQSSKKKIKKNINSVGSNGCEQNVKSVKNRKSSSKRTASLQNSAIDVKENSQQEIKAEKINEKEVKPQKQVHRNLVITVVPIPHSAAPAKSKKRKLSENDFNENSQQDIKAEKISEKDVKEQKHVRRNSDISAGHIPHSAIPPKSKKRKLSENNNAVQNHRVAYETKEFGTVKVPREIIASLKRVKLSITLLKEPVPLAKSQFNIKKIPILDGSADTSSSDDSVESKTPKKHKVTSQTLSIVRLSKQKKRENGNNTNKVTKARGSKERSSKPSTSPRKTKQKAVNLSQSSRESAYNPLDIIIKKSPKKGVRNKRTESQNTNRRRCTTSVIDCKSVESASGHEGNSDISAKHGVDAKDEQKSAPSVDASSQDGDILQSDSLSDSRTVDQSSLHTTTTSLKFINPHAAKRDTEHRRGYSQLVPYTQTTSSISNTSANVDNISVNQSASNFQKNSESEVCDAKKECRFSADTSCSSVFVNMGSASTSYPQNLTRLEHNLNVKALSEKTARKRLQFPKCVRFPEPENNKTHRSENTIPVHCSSDTKLNVQEVAHESSCDSDILKKVTHYSDKGLLEDKPPAEETKETRKGTASDAIIKHSAQPHEAFQYLEKMEHEDSDDSQDHGILSFYEVGLKSPDNINDTTILSTDSDNDCQSNSGKSKEEKCKEDVKGPNTTVSFTDSDSDSESSSDISKKKCKETINKPNFFRQLKIYTPLFKAPTKESILLTLSDLGIPEYVGQEPFVSDANDATKKKHIGNRTLQLCSYSVAELQDFTGGVQNRRGIEYWRNKLFHGFGPLSQMSTDQDATDLNLRASLASQRKTIITPSLLPPSVKDVELWLKAKELLRQKTDVEKLEIEGNKEKKPKTKVVIMPMSPGQESASDNEDVLSIISCSPLTPKEVFSERSASLACHSTPQQLSGKLPSPHYTPISKSVKQHSRLLWKDAVSASRRSSEATERSCNSPSLSTIAEDDEEHRPASEISLSPPDACLENTLKLDSSAEKEDRLPTSESCCEEQSASKVIQQSQYRKLLTTPKHLKRNSSCQIEGTTPDNSHGFRMSLDNLQDARAVSEHQYLTVLAMELHIQTRGDLRPDPTIDPIRALFYFIANDVPEDFSRPKESKGLIVVNDKSNHPDVLKQTASCHNVCYVPDEKSLFSELVNLIKKWDPDILVGYEVEMLSWGYLFQRAFTLQINLCPQVSRVPGGKSNNQNPESNNSQSLDFSHDIRLPGRIVLNVWRLMRHEITLQSYTFESVMYHVLHQRIPLHSFKQLTLWWDHKTHLYRWICVDYYMLRVEGIYRILQQLDLIERTSELARLFGIQFYEVLSRGSQFRVESMMLRLAKPLNYVPVSPSVRQRVEMRAPEALPLIMEPQSGFYTDPLIVLDFQSLYPSIIIAYNYCFSTCLGRVEQLGQNEAFKFGCTQLKVSPAHLLKLKNDLNFSPAGVAFVKERIRKGILPRMLQEILDTRLMVKKSMKEHKDNKILQRVLHSRQLGLKLIANVTYGYTAANFSGRMPCIEVGDSVVSKGRETLHRAISLVQNTTKWNAQVVYGDTDSLFVLVPGRTREQAFKIGAEIAEAVTMDNPKPVKLKLEKVYQPCILQTKKRYVGYMYETPDQEKPVYEAKGIETVRRDGCPAVAKIVEKSLKILFDTRDVSLVKKYVCRQFDKLIQGRINIQDLIFAKEYRGMKGYQPGVCIPALELTRRWLQTDKRAEPRVSERVPYVITAGPPGLPLIQLVRSPYELLQDPSLRINVTYYITRAIIPPLQRCFSLLGADVESWYAGMPRKAVTYLPAVVPEGLKKSTISHYFATTNCAVCDKQTHTGICSMCEDDPQSLAVTLENKLRQWERAYFNITKVCQSCCGRSESIECSSLDCPVLFRRNRALRDLDQGPFVRSILQQYLSF